MLSQTEYRNREKDEIGDAVKDPGRVVDELKCFLRANTELASDGKEKSHDADKDDGVDRRFVTRLQARKPRGRM